MKSKLTFPLQAAVFCMVTTPFLQSMKAQSLDPKRPNILCIVTEDISCNLGCYGDPVAKTPNLDRFSQQAIRYTNMHSCIGVSSPSRFALITGMYPSALGGNFMRNQGNQQYLPEGITPYEVVLPEHIKPYTEYLRAVGYFCTNNAKTDYQFDAQPSHWDENGSGAHWKNAAPGQPFMSIFNINTTHESQIFMKAARERPLAVDPADVLLPSYYPDDPVIREDMARNYTNIYVMDQETQAFLDELEESGLMENTIVIWYSDNGGPLPRGKRSIYNSGTNVPFMIRFPDGYRAGEVEDRLCSFVDVPATILSLTGVHVPDYMHGIPFAGDQMGAYRDYVYMMRDRFDEVIDKCGGIRDHRFQYIRNYMPEFAGYLNNAFRLQMPMMQRLLEMYEAGELNEAQSLWFTAPRPAEEFYDILNDPDQVHNLVNDPHFKQEIERLKQKYEEFNAIINVNWFRSEKEWMEIHWPGGKQPVVATPSLTQTPEGWVIDCTTPGASLVYKINYKPLTVSNDQNRSTIMQAAFQNDSHWNYYTGPVKVKKGDTITVMGCRSGYKPSELVDKIATK